MRRNGAQYSASNTGVIGEVGGLRSSAARFTNLRDADEPEVRHRAEVDWNTLALELDDLPPFDERFAMMRELYVSLPWS
jgi:hypothetical protein